MPTKMTFLRDCLPPRTDERSFAFPNPELSLLPGVFAQVKVPGSGKEEQGAS